MEANSAYVRVRDQRQRVSAVSTGKRLAGSANWQGDELIIELWMPQGTGELYLCDCWSLSPDGHTLTMEHRDDALAGQVAVLHRIG